MQLLRNLAKTGPRRNIYLERESVNYDIWGTGGGDDDNDRLQWGSL